MRKVLIGAVTLMVLLSASAVTASVKSFDCQLIDDVDSHWMNLQIDLDKGTLKTTDLAATSQGSTGSGSAAGEFTLSASISPSVISATTRKGPDQGETPQRPVLGISFMEIDIHRPTLSLALSSFADVGGLDKPVSEADIKALFGSLPDQRGAIQIGEMHGFCLEDFQALIASGDQEKIISTIRDGMKRMIPKSLFDADLGPQSPLGVWNGFPPLEQKGVKIERQLIITDKTVTSRAFCDGADGSIGFTSTSSDASIESGHISVLDDSQSRARGVFYCTASLAAGNLEFEVRDHALTLTFPDGDSVSLRREE